jgi:hypothetical protein
MPITDDFNRASLDGGWTAAAGTWDILSNACRATDNYENCVLLRTETGFPDDQYAQIETTVSVSADRTQGGVIVRGTGATAGYYVYLRTLNGTTINLVQLEKRVGGTFTYLADASISKTLGAAVTLKLTATGTALVVHVDGVQVISTTDSSVTSGTPGIFHQTGDAPNFITSDNWESTDVGGGGGGGGGEEQPRTAASGRTSAVRSTEVRAASSVCKAAPNIKCGVKDTGQTLIPTDYQTPLQPPSLGAMLTDPVTGTKIRRISDAIAWGHHRVLIEYSSISPVNCDSTRVLLYGEGGTSGNGLFIADLFGNRVVTLATFNAGGNIVTARWSRTDPNVLYAVRNTSNVLLKGTISGTGITWTTQHTFTGYTSIRLDGNGEGDLSEDGDRVAILCDATKLRVYKFSTDEVSAEMDLGSAWFDYCDLTADNEVLVSSLTNGAGNTQGVQLYDRGTTLRLRQVIDFVGHADRGRNRAGEPMLMIEAGNDTTSPPGGINFAGIEFVRISDGQKTEILRQVDFNMATHSSLNTKGPTVWLLVESQGAYLSQVIADLPGDWADNWDRYYNSLLLIAPDSSEIRHLCHTRTRHITLAMGGSNYWWQPRATMSMDGCYVAYNSNFALQPVVDYTDVYLIQIAPEPPFRSQPTISNVVAGTPGPSQVLITWDTDRECTSQVEVGPTTFYAEQVTPQSVALVRAHSVIVTSLSSSTLYHYRVISKDAWGNVRFSSDGTFTTAA